MIDGPVRQRMASGNRFQQQIEEICGTNFAVTVRSRDWIKDEQWKEGDGHLGSRTRSRMYAGLIVIGEKAEDCRGNLRKHNSSYRFA